VNKIAKSTMADFNPIHCWQRAWDDAHSNWGKACVVLFYLYIWSQAIWALETLFFTRAGWGCYYQGLSDYATEMTLMFIRAMNVMQLGFWAYAHREGIKVWNVSMVFIIQAAMWRIWTSSTIMDLDGAPVCGSDRMMMNITWALLWWTSLTLICSVLENTSKPQGTTSETNPIFN
jgi:hypothetical protein